MPAAANSQISTKTPTVRPNWILFTVGLATLLSSLNNSIINTVLPVINRALHLNLGESAWVVLIYLLVLSLFLLPLGRLSDLLGRRRIFLLGFLLFAAASILAGFAKSFGMLVFGRGLLALAGSMLLSVGPALITTTFPATQRGKALGIQALMTYLGLTLGPLVGGSLTQWFGWQSIFYSTVPVALIGFFIGLATIPSQLSGQNHSRLDGWSTFLYILAMVAVILMLNSNVLDMNPVLINTVLGLITLVAGLTFVLRQNRLTDPLIDVRLFKLRNFGFGTLGAIFNYLCLFLALFLLPLYMSDNLKLSPSSTGLWLTLLPFFMMISAPIAGAMSDKIGSRILSTSGMAANVLGLLCFALILPAPRSLLWPLLVVGLVLTGLGTGLFAAPNNAAIMHAAPASKQGMASGTLATARYVGMMGGITVGGSLFDTLLKRSSASGVHPAFTFTQAFSLVMWVGLGFGILGVGCALAMAKGKRQEG